MTEDEPNSQNSGNGWDRIANACEDAVEELNLSPRSTTPSGIFGGLVGPILLAAAGLYAAVMRKVSIYNPFFKIPGRPTLIATGAAAVAAGLALVAVGLVIHFRSYWYRRNAAVGAVGMVASFLMAILLAVLAGVLLIWK
jgi:hypothetical protein